MPEILGFHVHLQIVLSLIVSVITTTVVMLACIFVSAHISSICCAPALHVMYQ